MLEEINIRRLTASVLKCDPDELKIYNLKSGQRQVSNVWKLKTASGRLLAAKKPLIPKFIAAEKYSPFEVEIKTLELLNSLGCAVPKLIGYERPNELELGSFIMEWCGDQTLDDLCQSNFDFISAKNLAEKVVEEFCKIEMAFSAKKEELGDYIFPFNYPKLLTEQLKGHISASRQAIGEVARRLGMAGIGITDQAWRYSFEKLLEDLETRLKEYPTSPGVLDYNARNIVVGQKKGRVYFIDYSRIGFDWSARRLVQYTTSLGADRRSGNFISILSPELVKKCAEKMGNPQFIEQVEHHYILLFLVAISKILDYMKNPEAEEHRRLLESWGDPKRRLKSAFKEILKPLGEDNLAKKIREILIEGIEGGRRPTTFSLWL